MTTLADVQEAAEVARLGQSVYAPPGRLSPAQSEHVARELLEHLVRIAMAAGRAEGFEAGRRAGRLEVWRQVGAEQLVAVIQRDLTAMREDLEALGVECAVERLA